MPLLLDKLRKRAKWAVVPHLEIIDFVCVVEPVLTLVRGLKVVDKDLPNLHDVREVNESGSDELVLDDKRMQVLCDQILPIVAGQEVNSVALLVFGHRVSDDIV